VGKLLAVRGKHLRADVLAALPGVLDVVPFGAGLHVRGDEITEAAVLAALERHGATDVHVELTEPTLEDVFLAVATKKDAA
jgi:hypothetical protein